MWTSRNSNSFWGYSGNHVHLEIFIQPADYFPHVDSVKEAFKHAQKRQSAWSATTITFLRKFFLALLQVLCDGYRHSVMVHGDERTTQTDANDEASFPGPHHSNWILTLAWHGVALAGRRTLSVVRPMTLSVVRRWKSDRSASLVVNDNLLCRCWWRFHLTASSLRYLGKFEKKTCICGIRLSSSDITQSTLVWLSRIQLQPV